MKAILFGKELMFTENQPAPEPKEDEALIKVLTAGICNTDIEITKGYMGYTGILGHEFVGIVEKINSKNQELLGKRVVGEINCGCQTCDYCQIGLETHCQDRTVLGIFGRNGCFGEYTTLPLKNLYEVPDNISNQEATFVEPIAAAYEILEQIKITPENKVLVLGDGKLGLLVALVLNLTGAEVILVGKHSEKLLIAQNQGLKTQTLEEFKIEKIYDVVVEATGSINGFETAISLTKPRGSLVLKSTVASEKPLNLSQIVIDEITITGSRCGPFKPAINALKNKLIDVKPLISDEFDFKDAKQAFEKATTKGILKVLINF